VQTYAGLLSWMIPETPPSAPPGEKAPQ
jgi:hypothetical protein